MRAPLLLALRLTLLALAACARGAPPVAVAPPPAPMHDAPPPTCALPVTPRALVLHVERHVVPLGGDARIEAADVTTDGTCAPSTACVHVAADRLAALYALSSRATRVRRHSGGASPHYGSRSITIGYEGGECTVADDGYAQVERDDLATFDAAFDALMQAGGGH